MIRTLLQPPYHSRTFLTRDVYKTNALKAQICFFVDMGWILFVANLPKGEDVVFRFTGEKRKKKKNSKDVWQIQGPHKKRHGPVYIPDSPKIFAFLTPRGLKDIPYTQTKNPPPTCSNLGRMETCFRHVVWGRSPCLSMSFPILEKSQNMRKNHPNGNLPSLQIFAALKTQCRDQILAQINTFPLSSGHYMTSSQTSCTTFTEKSLQNYQQHLLLIWSPERYLGCSSLSLSSIHSS